MSEMKAIRAAYGEALAALGVKNEKIVALDADLAHATMTLEFAKVCPSVFLTPELQKPIWFPWRQDFLLWATFLFCSTFASIWSRRSREQVRNSVAYPNMNVKLAMTHAGITLGEDGGSHQAVEDLALMRVIPGMTVLVPCDAKETVRAVEAAAQMKGPVYLRLAQSCHEGL